MLAVMVSAAEPTITIGIPNQPNTKYLEGTTQTISVTVGDSDSNASDFNLSYEIRTLDGAITAIFDDINIMDFTGTPSDGDISGADGNTITYSWTVPTLGEGVTDTYFLAYVTINDGSDSVTAQGTTPFLIYNPPGNQLFGVLFGDNNIEDSTSLVEMAIYFAIAMAAIGFAYGFVWLYTK